MMKYSDIHSHRLLKSVVILLACLVCLALGAETVRAEIEVSLSGRTEKISSFNRGKITYYSLSEFLNLYGESLSWETVGESVVYITGDSHFKFFLGSSFINMNDTVQQITYPCVQRGGALYVPAETFTQLLDRAKSEQITWDPERGRLSIETGVYNITDLVVSEKANGLLIEIYMTEELKYRITESEGNWININFPDGRVNRWQIEARKTSRAFYDVNAFQFQTSAQVSMRLRRDPGNYTTKYQPDTRRLQISIRNPGYKPEEQHPRAGKIGPDNLIDLIVIDPGHGGDDHGAIGPGFTKEKDVALDISRELAKIIRKDKLFKVILTREKDVFVPLADRARIANEAQADVFLSIHANASTNRQARGSQVFFLAPAKTDAARALAQAENASFLTSQSSVSLDPADELAVIVNDMIQNVYEEASADLSDIIQAEFRRRLGIPARGVDQAGFVVLNEVFMPSCLIETAFISNSHEEKLLRDKDFKVKIAEAIYEGLKRFKNKYESAH